MQASDCSSELAYLNLNSNKSSNKWEELGIESFVLLLMRH